MMEIMQVSPLALGILTFIAMLLGYLSGYSDCKEHGGYLKGYNKAWDDVGRLLDEMDAGRKL